MDEKYLLYVLYDDDDNELPIMVTRTVSEMARKTGTKVDTLHSAISRKQRLKINGKKYKVSKITYDTEIM